MDVTCGISLNSDSTTMAQLETAIFTSDFDNIEKYSKKLRKKREISQALEVVLECYNLIHKNVRLHAATMELDLNHLIAYQIHEEIGKKIVGNLKKVLTVFPTSQNSSPPSSDLNGIEIKLTYVLLGIVSLFQFEKNSLMESLGYFDKIDFDLTRKFLLYDQSDTEIIQSTVIEKVFGILGLYFRGVALELHGRTEDALEQYQVVVDFLYRYRLVQFTKSRSVNDFITSSLYRSACLLSTLQSGSLFESVQVYKSFLTFHQINPTLQRSQPNNSTIRLIRALLQYMDILDKNFRKYNYKNFCDETPTICSARRADDSSALITSTNTRKEEIILCTLLLESIEQNSLVKASITEFGGTDSKKRFARIGYFDGIVKLQKGQFQKDVASNDLFKNLFYSYMASEKYDLALLSSRIYLNGHGGHCDDPFTLLSIAKLYLTIPSKLEDAHKILFTRLKAESLEAPYKISYHLLRGKYFLANFRIFQDESFLIKSKTELSLLLQIDECCAEAHFLLSLIAAHEGQIDMAEKEIKRSLSIDSSQIRAWNLFALIKTIKKDFEACLIICNTELANMIYKDINLSLLKVSTLLALNRSGEAIDTLKRIISAHFRKSLDIRMDGGLTVVSEGTLNPGNFLSKFLGESMTINGDGSVNGSFDLDASMFMNETEKITTFTEYTKSFPASVDEYLNIKFRFENEPVHFTKSSLVPDDILTPQDLKEQMYQIYQNSNYNNSNSHKRNNMLTSALWIEVARIYLQEGLFSDAQAATNQAFATNEVFAPIFGSFGIIQEIQGNSDSAITFYRKGLFVDKMDESCALGMARVLLGKSASDVSLVFEAEGLLRSLLQIDNSIPEAWSLLAQALTITGRHREAQECFELAIRKESVTPLRSLRSIQLFNK